MFAYLVTIAVSAGAGMLWGAKHPDRPVADFCATAKRGFSEAWDRLHGKKKEEAPAPAQADVQEAQ